MSYTPESIDRVLKNWEQYQGGSRPSRDDVLGTGSRGFESVPPSPTVIDVADIETAIERLPGYDRDCVWAYVVAGGNLTEARHSLRRYWADVRDAVDRSLVAMSVSLGTSPAVAEDSLRTLQDKRRQGRRDAARLLVGSST